MISDKLNIIIKILLLIFLLISAELSFSQLPIEPEDNTDIKQQIESSAENTNTESDFTDLIENLNYYKFSSA